MKREVEFTKQLVAIDSVATDEKNNVIATPEIISLTSGWLQELGYSTEIIRDSDRDRVSAILAPGTNTDLLFQGHLDTVKEGEWGKEPGKEHGYKWLGQIDEDNEILYGRGVVDMKGQIGAFFAALHETEKRPHVILTTDEEVGHITQFEGIRSGMERFNKLGLNASYAINMEPSNFAMVYSRKGAIYCVINVKGKSAHGSTPDKGISAISRAFSIGAAIEEHRQELFDVLDLDFTEIPYRTVNVGMIHGGNAPNTVAASCEIHLESRLLPGENGENAVRKLIEAIESKTDLHHGIEFTTDLRMNFPPYKASKTIARELVNRIPDKFGVGVGTYNGLSENFLIAQAGIPTFSLGAGAGHFEHSSDEQIKLEDLTRIKKCYLALMENK